MSRSTSIDASMYISRLKEALDGLDMVQIDFAVKLIEDAWREGRQVITMGNGGSALTAMHFVNDWNKSIYLSTGIPFRGRSLCDNIGLVMSYSNDLSYEDVFVEQLKNIMQDNDLVLAISGSGNSENVIRAINYANKHNAVTLGLCGYNGGQLKKLARYHVWAPVEDMQISEDIHFLFGHIVMQHICDAK